MATRAIDTRHLPNSLTTTAFARSTFVTNTKPSGNNIIVSGRSDNLAEVGDDLLFLQPYGSDAANENFHMRVIGWSECHTELDSTSQEKTWVGFVIADLVITLGNIAVTILGTNHFLADTIVLTTGDAATKIVSHASDLPGYLVVDPMGAQLIEIDVDKDAGGSEAATANVLWRWVSEESK